MVVPNAIGQNHRPDTVRHPSRVAALFQSVVASEACPIRLPREDRQRPVLRECLSSCWVWKATRFALCSKVTIARPKSPGTSDHSERESIGDVTAGGAIR